MENPSLLLNDPAYEAWSKPAGFSVHNEAPSMLEYFQKNRTGFSETHFLNRLDRETSGVVIVSKTAADQTRLQEIWQSATTYKYYVGLHRKPRELKAVETIWSEPLSDKSEGRKNPAGLAKDRVECRTHFIPVLQNDHLILSVMRLETGRQHQIRKHSILHDVELVGDFRYGDPKYNGRIKRYLTPLRLGLHAILLSWSPDGQAKVRIESPLPAFFSLQFPDAVTKVESALGLLD